MLTAMGRGISPGMAAIRRERRRSFLFAIRAPRGFIFPPVIFELFKTILNRLEYDASHNP